MYSELQDFILHNFKKEVMLAFVTTSSVSVSTKIKVLGFAKSIGVELCVEKVEGPNLHIAYSGKLGIELLIAPAAKTMTRRPPIASLIGTWKSSCLFNQWKMCLV